MIWDEQYDWTQQYYMNMAQIKSTLIDPNVLIAEISRAGGKTEGFTGPRILRVAKDMPRELAFLDVYKRQVRWLSVGTCWYDFLGLLVHFC